jgi:hypothetical protein
MLLVACCRTENSKTLEPDAPNPVVKPFDWEKEAEQVITAYVQALTEGDTVALRNYVWRYAAESALEPPPLTVKKAQVAKVEAQGGFGSGLTMVVFQAKLTETGATPGERCGEETVFFVLAKEPEDNTFKVAGVSKNPVNPFENKRKAVEKAECEAAKEVVNQYFEDLGRQDFNAAARWVHPLWSDGSASPDRAIRKLRLLSIEGPVVQQAGQVPLLEYAVTADARYPSGLFTGQPHPRSSGRNVYFVILAPINPLAPTEWRIISIGTGP